MNQFGHIGTGVTAQFFSSGRSSYFIRSIIFDKYGENVSANCSILYGGSCNPNNERIIFKRKY